MSEKININALSTDQIYNWKVNRWLARTNLGYLCRNVLNYHLIDDVFHAPVLNILQKFPKPTRDELNRNTLPQENNPVGYDILGKDGQWKYKPLVQMDKLQGKRRRLILDPRGHAKTTINAQAHTIQWILNYPNIAMMVVQSTGDKAEAIVGSELRVQFCQNKNLRSLFPELCPKSENIKDFGTKGAFLIPGRASDAIRREPTVMAGSIDKGSAGYHFDVMKFSDIVSPENVGTVDQLQSVKNSYFMMENLLNAPEYWIDVEGTRYHFQDLYGRLIELWEEDMKTEGRSGWDITVRSVYQKDTGGEPRKYTPDECKLPNLLDADGNPIPVWPGRFTYEGLKREERQDPYIFSCQKLLMPNASAGRDAPFPVDDNYPKFIPRKDFNQNVPIAYRELCIDTAETANARSNYSSICVAAWSGNGKCYIDEIVHGKYLPDKLVKLIISTFLKYNKPHCPVSAIKIEETGFVRGLSATFGRYQDLNGINLPISYIKRDTTISKNERILNTLQPWYKSGDLVFLEDIECKTHMLSELEQFPLSATDDILDSVADVFQGKTWFGRETTRDNESRKGIDRRAHDVQQTFARLQDYHFKQFTNQGGMEWTTPGDPMDSVNPDNYRY